MSDNTLILIVDDQADNRFAMKLALKKESYEFIEAENGKEAVEKAIEFKPDVILMDAIMPVMDGFEATIKMRQEQSLERTPILMVTALNEKDDRIKALEAGVSDFVTKPFDKHEVIARCRAYVNMSKLNKRYVDATQNPVTGLPNTNALYDKLRTNLTKTAFTIMIDGYKGFSEFYTSQIIKKMELAFISLIYKHFPLKEQEYKLFNTEPGVFSILFASSSSVLFTNSDFANFANTFYSAIRSDKIVFDDFDFDVSVTIGIGDSPEQSYKHSLIAAKQAMNAKKPFLFAADIIEKSRENVQNNIVWVKKIKDAMIDDRFVPYFQPIYNNKEKKIEKFESLIRMIDEDSKVISPFFFMDISKKAKYYHQLTRLMVEKSINVFKDKTVDFSVNIAGSDIEDDVTRKFLIEKVKNNPDTSKRMIFELLEDESFESFELLTEFITEVKSYGVKIAIDDFGSGYSNFTRLMEYQPDILKLDGSLIKNINTDLFSLNIVNTMKNFTDEMKLQTVAEFVCSKEILEKVTELGITYTQGYEISEPVPADEVDKLIEKYS